MSLFRTLSMDIRYLLLWLNGVKEKEMFIEIYQDKILLKLVVLMLQEILLSNFISRFNLQTKTSDSMEFLKNLIKQNSSNHIQQKLLHLSWLLLVLFTFQRTAYQEVKRELVLGKSVKSICSCMVAQEKFIF